MNYRSQGEDELFELWCNTFFRPGYGTAAFRDRAKRKPVSEILTVYDEAFIVATIDNNYERWMKEAEILTQGDIVNKKKLPRQKYTNDAAASKKFQGWSTEGLEFFNKTVNDLIQLRNTSSSKLLEKNYMEKINRDMMAKKTRKGALLPETQAVDGLQAYLESFFPNLVHTNQGPNGAGGHADTTGGPGIDPRQTKRQRISLTPERNPAMEDEDYESDVDGPSAYHGYDDARVGQTGEV
jgi:hypothetical protein